MNIFSCSCDAAHPLYFDSLRCDCCDREVGFDPDTMRMRAVGEGGLRRCDNGSVHGVCNWLVSEDDALPLCRACRLNRVIPDLGDPQAPLYWARIEAAKRRALYGLMALGLDWNDGFAVGEGPVLRFRFMADRKPASGFEEPLADDAEPVYTGHNEGEITINLAEADEVQRTRIRTRLGERYRTLLGHFRHELGHYYYERLIAEQPDRLADFRACFGDPSLDYAQAMNAHYQRDPTEPHPEHISHYATMHPWEDWAETWAHYLHMMDGLDTAANLHLAVSGRDFASPFANGPTSASLETWVARWLRLAEAMNTLNRSMGLADAYPFVLNPAVQRKLEWVHARVGDSVPKR